MRPIGWWHIFIVTSCFLLWGGLCNHLLANDLPTDFTGYETVTITIPASAYNADAGGIGLGAPQMARVKYNKLFPLVITSDDMGKTELTNNWAAVNGYPVINDWIDLGIQPGGTKFLQAPYKKYYMQGRSSDADDYQPMTYTDNVGKTQRYRITSAVMPYDLASNNYAKINANDAKLMLRTGWSFAQHDVDNTSSVDAISTAMTTNSTTWENQVGIGLKVMVEPNGNHNYLDAGKQNSGICWNIFQNPATGYPGNDKTLTDWTDGTMPTTFSSKPDGGYTRTFFQGNETAWKNEVESADGTKIVIGGTHGIGDDIKTHLRTATNVTDNAWVGSADEVWEYYHIYNNVVIENVNYAGGYLTFDVKVPTYNKHQYRELTINIPGLTGGGTPTFSTASGKTVPVTGGYNASGGTGIGYTLNIGLESSITTHISDLMAIYRDDQTNLFVKRDMEYLISQLWDGSSYTTSLNADPTYDLTVGSLLDGSNGPTLATIKTDTNGDKSFAVPRYILNGTTLYEHAANGSKPYYVNTITTSADTPSAISYTAKDLSSLATGATPVFYAEGEDLDGVAVVGADFDVTANSSRKSAMEIASMGMGGNVVSGIPATVTSSLPRGTYKIVIGYGDTNTGTSSTYNVNVNGTLVYSFTNSGVSENTVNEFTSKDFNIATDNLPITITSDYTASHNEQGSHWIDYVYIVKTADLEAIAPTLTFTSSTTASTIKTGTTATLTANALPNGGNNISTSIYAADSEETITGDALATGTTSATYSFTPSSDGTSYFVAQSTNSVGTTTSQLITLTATSITNYTLNIVDKSGNTAMTTTIANPGSPAETDPLPVAYRSPFAENYHYYLNAEDAQNNNTANALASTDDWSDATIYVGYDVKSNFGADKKFAVWVNNRYMHMVYRVNQAHSDNRYYIQNQKYDITDIPSGVSSELAQHELSTANYTLLDNHFMWNLGDDPYNVLFLNVANGNYVKTQYNNSPSVQTNASNGDRFCIIYWQAKANNSAIDTSTDYCRLYNRSLSTNSTLADGDTGNRFLACSNDNNCEWRTIDRNHGSYDTFAKIYIQALPEVTVNVLNSHGEVEAQLQAYNNSAATMQSFIPYSMLRAYTSGHALFYDAAHTDAVSSSAVLDASKLEANGGNLYMTYTLSDEKWRTVVKDAITYSVHSFDSTVDSDANWYGLRYNKTNTDASNYIKATAFASNPGTANLSDFTGSNADTDNGKQSQWALIGTPYHLEIANRYLGFDSRLGIPSSATTSSKVQVFADGTADVITTWEVVTWLNQGKSHLFFRPQGGFNGQAPYLYWSGPSGLSVKASGGEMFDFYWATSTTQRISAPTVTLTASPTSVYIGNTITLTATPSLHGNTSLSSILFQYKKDSGEWTDIATVTEDLVSGENKTQTFIPTSEGSYVFRATATDNGSLSGTSEETSAVTVTAAPTLSTVTLSASSSNPVAGSTVTLTATATPATGYTVARLVIEQKNTSTDVWEKVGDAYTASASSRGNAVRRASTIDPSTGEVTVTYDFTAGAVGTNYEFRANATFSDGINTPTTVLSTDAVASGGENQSLQLTSSLPTPALSSYTLELIDHSGGTVFTESGVSASTITSTSGDPLSNQYRSPFVATYKYYKHTDAGKASAALGEDANLTDWSDESGDGAVYVGYVTDASKMGTDKVHAIWANDRYFHFVYRRSQSNNNRYVLDYQNYDIWNETVTGSGYSPTSGITISNFALLDNNYMWQLGDDPYRITFLNKATQFYANPTANSNANWGASSTGTYSILYWTSADGSSTDTSTDGPCRILYRGSSSYVAMTDDSNYNIRAIDTNHSKYTASSKIYIKQLPHLTINVLDRRDAVEAQFDAYYKSDATMQANVPYSLIRAYTSDHTLYYDATHNDAVTMSTAVLDDTKLTASSNNLYLKYTLDTDRWHPDTPTTSTYTSIVSAFEDGYDDDANWYAMRYNTTSGRFYSAATGSLPADIGVRNSDDTNLNYILGNTTTTGYDATQGQWALIGTPYHLEIANRYHGFSSRIGIVEDATASTKPKIYASDATGVITTWEAVNYLNGQGNSFLFFRPQGGFNGQAPLLYLSNSSNVPQMSTTPGGGEKFDFYWAASTTEAVQPAARLTLSATATSVYVDGLTTLTATATPDTGKDVTYFAIEQETGNDEWTVVGTAYAGTNVANATKDGEGVVTVTYEFAPTGAGTYKFRAKAIVDGETESPILSTYDVADGGTGSALAITATVETITVKSDNYTLILVDKSGNQLFIETNVSADRVSGTNSISGRNGDPLANDWRSPIVARYYYYSTLEDAKNNSGSNLFDWSSTATTPTVYVGYATGTDIDLNSTHFSSVSDLMNDRTARTGTTNTSVRDASKFGKMYMLKFKMSEDNYLEDGGDDVEETATAAGTYVYPYTNGDGPMYVYTQSRWNSQSTQGASTRTRWPWYLVSPTNDPYHVVVTSWQNSHSLTTDGVAKNFYSYFHTYYNTSLGQVITSNVTDDDRTLDANSQQIMPTEYMVLYGTTEGQADGRGYRLMTTNAVDDGNDGTTDERQTVTSLEQYWRNNPTALYKKAEANGTQLTKDEKEALKTGQSALSTTDTDLATNGWHNYKAYVNAAPWGGGSKTYANDDHWFQTISVGDGSFQLVETDIDAVLVLIDQHGWELMRHNIVKHNEQQHAEVEAFLRQYDSPMVSQYKFYGYRNVSHKVPGYHKYVVSESDLAGTATSLADYPEKYSGGALYDLYVTYDVKEEYTNSYTPAATEAECKASQLLVMQGSNYAKANGAAIEGTADAASASTWLLKPNFDIDAEMGYLYDSGTDGESDKATTDQTNYDEGRNGFDPYNLRLQLADSDSDASNDLYLTTNATTATLDGNSWTGDGTTVSLATLNTSPISVEGHDNKQVAVTNQTFMAVQDANGNMRLMPRFDHAHVIEGFTALAEPASAQPANDTSHGQTTRLTTGTITYHIVDNSGTDVFGAQTYTGPGFAIDRTLQSPMVEEYYYHASLTDAQNADKRGKADKTSFSVNDEVWISYKVKDDFNASKAYNIYGSGNYMHAVYRYGQTEDIPNNFAYLWWMRNQTSDRDDGNTISTTTFPFLDNTYAWQVGDNPDPYNVKFLNKGARRYLNQQNTGNDYRMEELAIITTAGEVPSNATPFCILYYDNSSDDCTLYNRTHNKYVYNNGSDWRADASRTGDNRRLTITELPAININVVNAAGEVECTLEGYYKSGCTWSNSFTPFYLQRINTSNHQFYYTLEAAAAKENAITGTVDDTKVTSNGAVYVRYDLSADWGAATDDADLTAKHTAQIIKVIPSPTNDKINWYAVRTGNNKYIGAAATATPANLAEASSTNATTDAENDANKLAQWAFIGTPYNLKLVDRYHGTSNYLGISEAATAGNFAFIDDGTADITTWEVCTGYSGNSKLLIRPQRSLNGETPYLYIGWNGGSSNMSLAASTGGNYGLDLTWVKETDAKFITFKLYDRDGKYMADAENGAIADAEIHGVSIGDALSVIFEHTNMERRYCEYKFFSDAEMKTEVTNAGNALDETVYVKWDYTDDAPVFNEGVANSRDYQYYMMGVGSGSYYTLMDVEESSGTYTFKPMDGVVTPRDQAHQFAIVGNPYKFYLYNRGADKNIRRKASLDLTFEDTEDNGTTPTEELEFDMPIVSTLTYSSTECSFRSKKSGRFLTVSNNAFTMTATSSPTQKTRFRYIIVPVRVFKEGATTWTSDAENDQKDYRMYGLEMNPNVSGTVTARSTSERITTDYLRASGNAIGTARDYRHAFCDYTYYRSYDWTEYLSDPIPTEGLSYYGGKEQNKKQFFATYTVDEQAFSRLYYMNANNNSASSGNEDWQDAYIGKGSSSTNGYTLTASREFTTQVKTDENDTYRWFFTGDPYDMQIHCVGVGELNSDYVLALKKLSSTGAPTEVDGTAAVLTADLKEGDSDSESYGQFSHFEIIQRSSGQYVLWSIDTDNRYDYCLTNHFKHYNGAIHLAQAESNINMNTREWMLVDVFNHYTITWHVMESHGTTGAPSYADVASKDVVYDENTVLQVEDLPTELRRHFCEYSEMYSDNGCTAALPNNALTVTASTSIYVPYTLDSGAPDFLSEAPTSETAEKYWYEIHYPGLDKYIYYKTTDGTLYHDSQPIETIRNLGDGYTPYRWALIGTPYSVKFYNKQTSSYLTTDGSTLSMSASGTTFDLMNDETGEWCAILDATTNMYVNATANVQRPKSYYSTSAEFTNTNGVVKIAFVLHYSANTLRRSYANGDDTSGTPANGTTETIKIDSYQKIDKALDDVLPTVWKRAFCKYTYYWDTTSAEEKQSKTTVTNVSQAMVDAYNDNKDKYLYVHVEYDYETDSPFQWSTADATWANKHWYYLVNNHIQGSERGKMVYRDSGPKLRVSQGLVDDRQYLYNFEWCVIGDPYGFKMLNHYDPDELFSQYISVTGGYDSANEGLQIEQQSGNTQCLFEMMPGRYSYNFWMHPIYDYDLMGDEYEYNSYSYVGHNYNGSAAIIPNNKYNSTYLHNNAAANLRLEMRTNATLKEYLDYAGFVGSIKTSVVPEGLAKKITNGTATDEELKDLHNLIDDPSNLVQMKEGYYRIIPYVYEKGKIDGEQAHRRYVRGYHYGSGTEGYDNTGTASNSNHYYDRQEIDNSNANWDKSLMANEPPEHAVYDPASIFLFKKETDGEGHPRYKVSTQGLHLSGHSLGRNAGYDCRYEDIGAVTCQLKTVDGDPTDAANHLYLSWQQNSTNNEPDDYRRMALRNCFEMYGFTRLYLQPVGSEAENLLPLKTEVYPGTYAGKDYYFATLYVPYDVKIETEGAYAYVGKRTVVKESLATGQEDDEDWRLQCDPVPASGGYAEGKFVPAGTPVLIRAEKNALESAITPDAYDVDGYDRQDDSKTYYVTLSLPSTTPSTPISSDRNYFRGQYLEQVLSGGDTPGNGQTVYVFGQATKDDYKTKDASEVGFYQNKNTTNGRIDGEPNNLYVRHNKIYVFGAKRKADLNEEDLDKRVGGSTRRCISVHFEDEGIEEFDGNIHLTLPTGTYDLKGLRVSDDDRDLRPGVYIRNGKKIVIKRQRQ